MVSKLLCLVANDRQLDVTATGRDGSELWNFIRSDRRCRRFSVLTVGTKVLFRSYQWRYYDSLSASQTDQSNLFNKGLCASCQLRSSQIDGCVDIVCNNEGHSSYLSLTRLFWLFGVSHKRECTEYFMYIKLTFSSWMILCVFIKLADYGCTIINMS